MKRYLDNVTIPNRLLQTINKGNQKIIAQIQQTEKDKTNKYTENIIKSKCIGLITFFTAYATATYAHYVQLSY